MERAYGYARVLATGAPAPLATVTVYDVGTLNLAAVFSDNLGTVKANPFLADSNAYFFFYAANGRYDIQFSGVAAGIPTPYTWGDEVLSDFITLNGLSGPSQTFAVGTAGTDFAIVSAGTVHTFNIPNAGAAARGLVSTGAQIFAGQKTFTSVIAAGSGGTGVDGSAAANGKLLIGNGAGYSLANLTGTANRVTVSNGAGSITLSGPQDLHTGASPTFASVVLTALGAFDGLLGVAPGGGLTPLAPMTDGQLAIGRTGAQPLVAALTAGTGISIVNGAGTITIASIAVTSINASTVGGQTLVVGTTGGDFAISTVGATGVTTFNLPDAGSASRGVVTTGAQNFAGVKNFVSPPIGFRAYARCTAQLRKNASVAFADITGLSFPIAANEVWTFAFHVKISSDTTADAKLQITGPAAPTAVMSGMLSSAASIAGTNTGTAFSTTFRIATTANPEWVVISGHIRNGVNAGTVQLQGAQDTSNATNTDFEAESFVVAERWA